MKKLVNVLHIARDPLIEEHASMTSRDDSLPFRVAWHSTALLAYPALDIRVSHVPAYIYKMSGNGAIVGSFKTQILSGTATKSVETYSVNLRIQHRKSQ